MSAATTSATAKDFAAWGTFNFSWWKFWGSRNDASQTVKPGSDAPVAKREYHPRKEGTAIVPSRAFNCTSIFIPFVILTLASTICPPAWGQEAAGPIIDWGARLDRIEQRADNLTAATDRHTTALSAVGDNVKEAIEALKALGVGAFWLVVLGGCFALAYKVLDIVKAWMLLLASRKET